MDDGTMGRCDDPMWPHATDCNSLLHTVAHQDYLMREEIGRMEVQTAYIFQSKKDSDYRTI